MNTEETQTRTVVIERDIPHRPGIVWRALTEQSLIADWLMTNNFEAVTGNSFKFTADWGSVEGKVLTVEQDITLSYTWEAYGLESVVTWTLIPTEEGTHLRMEQSGFRPDQNQAYNGAKAGWKNFLDNLERVVGGLA